MSDSYNCPICHDIFVEPTILMCGHTYCAACIKSMVNNKCALDQTPFKKTAINYALQSIISEIYKDDIEYKKRVQLVESRKQVEANIKYLQKTGEFKAVCIKIQRKIQRFGTVQLSKLVSKFGIVLTWTCLSWIIQKKMLHSSIYTFKDYLFKTPIAFVLNYHEELSKEDILYIIDFDYSIDGEAETLKTVNNMVASEEFIVEVNKYIESIKPIHDKCKNILSLEEEIGIILTTATFISKLSKPANKKNFKKIFGLMDISFDSIYNKSTDKWVLDDEKCRAVYGEYIKKRDEIRQSMGMSKLVRKAVESDSDKSSESSESEESVESE